MAVPRNRLSNARKNSRRAHHAKTPKNVVACKNCSAHKLPHTVCQACGFYGDRIVLHKQSAA
jgi:large subunit ribosomal protein L32